MSDKSDLLILCVCMMALCLITQVSKKSRVIYVFSYDVVWKHRSAAHVVHLEVVFVKGELYAWGPALVLEKGVTLTSAKHQLLFGRICFRIPTSLQGSFLHSVSNLILSCLLSKPSFVLQNHLSYLASPLSV